MAKIKINSIGFGYDKNILLSERLIKAGTAMIIAGLFVNHTKSKWYVTEDQSSLDAICETYERITSRTEK